MKAGLFFAVLFWAFVVWIYLPDPTASVEVPPSTPSMASAPDDLLLGSPGAFAAERAKGVHP